MCAAPESSGLAVGSKVGPHVFPSLSPGVLKYSNVISLVSVLMNWLCRRIHIAVGFTSSIGCKGGKSYRSGAGKYNILTSGVRHTDRKMNVGLQDDAGLNEECSLSGTGGVGDTAENAITNLFKKKEAGVVEGGREAGTQTQRGCKGARLKEHKAGGNYSAHATRRKGITFG